MKNKRGKHKAKKFYFFGLGTQIVVSVVLLAAAIIATVWNTSGLVLALYKSTDEYILDVSSQLSDGITARLQADITDLELVADSIPQLQSKAMLEEFLERKITILDYDSLFVLGRRGDTVPSGLGENGISELSSVQASFQGENRVMYREDQSLLFSTPIATEKGIEAVLIGLIDKENMKNLIQPVSFDGRGMTCIVDGRGQVIISPTDLKPFMQLADIFEQGNDEKMRSSIMAMQQDWTDQQEGLFRFTAVDKAELVMTYHPLYINDWILLTLVPADLIAGGASNYISRTYGITVGIIAVFVLILVTIYRVYNTHKRQLETVAYVDPLTGGMNNAAFQMNYRILSKKMLPSTHVVILLNIKRFKLINDNFGVEAGSDTLKYIYRVLNRHIRPGELLARAEADNFFLCLQESNTKMIDLRLQQMVEDVNSFNKQTDIPYHLMFSQGAYMVDDPDLEITIIQGWVRSACQDSGRSGLNGCVFYDPENAKQMKLEQELESLCDESISNRDFQVYLQPKVRLADNTLGGAEALVRWTHPKRGVIYPSDFIPALEKTGKICRLDLYVFEETCRVIERWHKEGRVLFPISVNLSRQHFRNPNFLRQFSDIAGQYNIPPGMIEFEMTESIFFEDEQFERVKDSIAQMHELGFLCSLDDFGSGFSSLGLLKEFDVDTVKLDRRFFADIRNPKAQNIIQCLIELAERLKVHTVAEGIETREQLDYLRSVRCDMVQGYIFSKPLSVQEFENWRDRLQVNGI